MAEPASIRRLIRDCKRHEANPHCDTETSALLRDVISTMEAYLIDLKKWSKEPTR